jgi:integrase
MGRKREFPITLKAGATAIKIYYSPHRVQLQSKERQYDSYVVSYYRGEKRFRARFNSLEDAETEAQRIQTSILNEDLAALQLTGRDRLVYARAQEVAEKIGVDLDVMAKEYAAARQGLGSTTLTEAVEFHNRFGKTVKENKTVPSIVEELLSALRSDEVSEYHVRDMQKRLGAFAEKFTKPILQVTSTELQEWLRSLKKEDAKGNEYPLAPKTRNHYRNALVQLFNFARDSAYLPKGLPTEAESLKSVKVTPSENEIFAVDEMIVLLQTAPDHLVVPMAIKAFSGVRTEEMVKLHWEHIDWDGKHIKLPASVTKTTQRRLIPLSENLIKWIAPLRQERGRICLRWKRPQALVQAFERHGTRNSIDVGANKFRNSYISYRVAITKDVQRVALESGNSPRVIQREYLELATESEALRWFGIVPGMQAPALAAEPTRLAVSFQQKKPGHIRVRAGRPKKLIHYPSLPVTGVEPHLK